MTRPASKGYKRVNRSALLYRDVVRDVRHALDRTCDLTRASFLFGRINEAGELHIAFERRDAHLAGIDGFVFYECGLHFGGDGSIIDVFAGAFPGVSRGTAGVEGNEPAGANREQDNKLDGVFHIPVEF